MSFGAKNYIYALDIILLHFIFFVHIYNIQKPFSYPPSKVPNCGKSPYLYQRKWTHIIGLCRRQEKLLWRDLFALPKKSLLIH